MNPPYSSELDSPNDMVIDSEEIGFDGELEKDDVVLINPDSAPERADDVERMKELVLPSLFEQPPIKVDAEYTWEIKNWRSLPRRGHSPVFEAGGYPWRVLLFPSGNNCDQVSLYLEHGFDDGGPPDDFACCVQFGLVMWNPEEPEVLQHHTAHHRFTKEEGDWGFTRFVDLRKLTTVPFDAQGRFLMSDRDAVNITAYVRIVEDETGVLWHNFNTYDSKKETGFVGLKNQGATCYLNSLIQSLYFTNAFRRAIYQIPTENEETLQNSAYTLQRLFYQLQTSNSAVSTNELTKSFGWEARHIFEQQDVQELSRKLMERMEEKMKGTEAEHVLPNLFCGKQRTYISCINVQYESRRSEEFWDVQLNVSGMKNIEASFKNYVDVEVMNGENQYFAGDEFKLQDANKGVIFESFPDVLHLQLKRFQYDFERDAMMKINDRYEFPESFDAAKYLADDASRSESWVYKLHGVLVHSGDLNAGHYYAFIKPEKDGWFYKYDDDRVTKATKREVMEDNFGGSWPVVNGHVGAKAAPFRIMSAYMLVYIRETRLDKVLVPVTKADTPPHLQTKLDEEAASREARRKERDEQHLYLGIKIITNESFKAHGGTDLTTFDPALDSEPGAPKCYRFLRKSTVKELADVVGEDINTDPRKIRFWRLVNRQNKTTRPDSPVNDTHLTIEETHQNPTASKSNELRLWAEVAEEVDENGDGIFPSLPSTQNGNGSPPKSDLIVLFLKWFDVEEQRLKGCGHVYISNLKKVEDLHPIILQRMGWLNSSGTVRLKLYEEIKPNMIEPMKPKQSLKAAELQDGDIVCFQRVSESQRRDSESTMPNQRTSSNDSRSSDLERDSTTAMRSPSVINIDNIEDARMFYEFLLYRKSVKFHPHPLKSSNTSEESQPFELTLSLKHTYDQVSKKVSEHLGTDSTHIRFWSVNNSTGAPKAPIKRGQAQTLQTILTPPYGSFNNTNQRSDALYFELLDISLSELDTKKSIKVIWLSDGITKEEVFDILVPKNGTAQDLLEGLIKKAKLDDEATAGPIRMYEVHSNKIHRELLCENLITSINDFVQVVAERIPEEDVGLDSEFIQAFHFQGEPNKAYGIPFRFRLEPGEVFSETKKRLEKRTGIKGKNLEKIKFAVVKRSSYTKPQKINDDDIIASLITGENDFLGLDHVDRSRTTRNGPDLFLK